MPIELHVHTPVVVDVYMTPDRVMLRLMEPGGRMIVCLTFPNAGKLREFTAKADELAQQDRVGRPNPIDVSPKLKP